MLDPADDLAAQLELRDELLQECRDILAKIGTRKAASLVRQIEALLDLEAA